MAALIGLLTTFLVLEGTGFGSTGIDAHPLAWLLMPIATPLVGIGIASALARRNVPVWRRRRLLRGFYLLAYLVTYGALVDPAGWGDFVMVRLGWLGRPLASHALLLVPAVPLALWAGIWFYRADRRLTRTRSPGAGEFLAWLGGSARLILVPFALLVIAIAVVQGLHVIPRLGSLLELYPSLATAVSLGLLAVVIVLFPRLLLLAWPSRPLPPGDLRTSLDEMAARAGVRLRDVRVWERTATLVNACVTGHFSRSQRVFFTGGAREYFTDDGLRAVFAHEISHITSGHLWCYAALLAAYVLALSPLQQSLDAAPPWVLGLAFLALTIAVWWAFFGYVSRRLEVEADVRGAALVTDGTYVAALERVRGLLGSRTSARHGWRHFSLDRRSQLLREALARPETKGNLLLGCKRWKLACYALLLASVLGFSWSTSRDLSRPSSTVAFERSTYALEQAGDLRRIIEERDAHPGMPSWTAWAARALAGIEAEYAEALARARDDLARIEPREGLRGDPTEQPSGKGSGEASGDAARSLRAEIEDHVAWWNRRGS